MTQGFEHSTCLFVCVCILRLLHIVLCYVINSTHNILCVCVIQKQLSLVLSLFLFFFFVNSVFLHYVFKRGKVDVWDCLSVVFCNEKVIHNHQCEHKYYNSIACYLVLVILFVLRNIPLNKI